MTTIYPQQFVDNSTIEIKYCDSEGWTVPVILTQERLDKVYQDLSIEKIKLTTKDALCYELEVL